VSERPPAAPVLHLVLVAPQIPTNTGAIIRLAANIGADLHLVEPLGFDLDARSLRRGGLDYHELVNVHRHDGWPQCRAALPSGASVWGLTSDAHTRYCDAPIALGDALVFGCEADGLSDSIRKDLAGALLRIPMVDGSRSMNLANAAATVSIDAWRRLGFPGAAEGAGVDGCESFTRDGRGESA